MSRPKLRIKRDDTVIVITGKDKGRIGRVLRVLPDESSVVVEGVRRVKRHQRPSGDQPGTILSKEMPIHVSNVALWNAAEKRRVKVTYKVGDDGSKTRVDRESGQSLDKR